MARITLPSPDGVSLEFEGEQVLEIDSTPIDPKKITRWYSFRLYRTRGGVLIVQIEYQTRSKMESPGSWLVQARSSAELRKKLDSLAADSEDGPAFLEHVQWWPEPQNSARNAAIERGLETSWMTSVSKILAAVGETRFIE